MKLLLIIVMVQFLSSCIANETFKDLKTDFSWKTENVDHQEAWQAAGINTPQEAKGWIKIGINRYTVKDWAKRGIKPSDAKKWLDSGLEKDRIFGYLDAGVTSASDAKKWKKVSSECGVNAKDCLKIGINNPESAGKWFKAGFNKEQMNIYTAFGVTSSSQAVDWYNAGANEDVINKWTKQGVTLKQAEKRMGTLVDKNKEWKNLKQKDFTWSEEDYKSWRKTSLTPSEVHTWVQADLRKGYNWVNAGVKNINDVKKWVKAGIPEGYDWINAGIKNLNDAKGWKAVGLDPVLAPVVQKQGYTRSKLSSTCGLVLSSESLTSSNPYKYKDKCVKACVKVNQILSPSKIFGYIADERAVSVTAPSKVLSSFSVGDVACGIYKIQDASDFSLIDNRTVKGNTLKSILNIDSRVYLLHQLSAT